MRHEMPCAALVCDEAGRIVGWNAAIELILGHRANDVIGQPCHRVLCGMDVFGNRFCTTSCTLMDMARRRTAIRDFSLRVRTASGIELHAEFSVFIVILPGLERMLYVHIIKSFEQIEHADEPPAGIGSLPPASELPH